MLAAEDSPHAVGAKLLADDYANQFGLTEVDRIGVGGIASPWFPAAPATCRHSEPKACQRPAIPGTDLCQRHGGAAVLSPADRAMVSRAVADRLVELSERAVRVVEDMMDQGRSEKVRLDAAIAVLDRTGVGPTTTLRLEAGEDDGSPSPAQVIAERLERLGDSARAQLESAARGIPVEDLPGEIVEAELVADDDTG